MCDTGSEGRLFGGNHFTRAVNEANAVGLATVRTRVQTATSNNDKITINAFIGSKLLWGINKWKLRCWSVVHFHPNHE